jgi:hypothetical protein
MIEDYYVARYLWEFIMARRKREFTEKINSIEFKLKEFYYPIFFYLKREQIIWDKILILYKNPCPDSPPISILPASKKALGKAIKKRESLLNKKNSSIKEDSISITIENNSDNKKIDDNEIIDKNIKILNEQIDKIQKIQDRENLKIMTDKSDTIYLDIIKALFIFTI